MQRIQETGKKISITSSGIILWNSRDYDHFSKKYSYLQKKKPLTRSTDSKKIG